MSRPPFWVLAKLLCLEAGLSGQTGGHSLRSLTEETLAPHLWLDSHLLHSIRPPTHSDTHTHTAVRCGKPTATQQAVYVAIFDSLH